jgi:hypothetical protein
MRILLLLLIGVLAATGRGVLVLPDYPAMFRDADVVAIIRFVDLKDTNKTKELTDLTSAPSGLQFRELNSHIKVLSLLKGTADDPMVCRVYRFPTFDECVKDLGSQDEARRRLTACLRDLGLVHVFWAGPDLGASIQDLDFLVYLKKTEGGVYIPVTGDSDSQSAIRQLEPPSISTRNKQEAEQAVPPNGP